MIKGGCRWHRPFHFLCGVEGRVAPPCARTWFGETAAIAQRGRFSEAGGRQGRPGVDGDMGQLGSRRRRGGQPLLWCQVSWALGALGRWVTAGSPPGALGEGVGCLGRWALGVG